MSVREMLGNFFHFHALEKESNKLLDVDEDGHQLFKEDVISFVTDELERRRQERNPLEQQWRLNANFMAGNQYCDFNIYRGEIEQIKPTHDWLEREVFNQIEPLIETRIANLKKINYRMKVNARTNELDDYEKAEVATNILQFIQTSTDFDSKKNTAIQWNELCGNCFWLSWWDNSKGDKYAVETVVELDENGIEKKSEKAYYQGDIDYGLLTPYEVFPESIFRQSVEEQRSIITEQVKTVDEIYDLYGIKVDGTEVSTFELTPVISSYGYGYEGTSFALGTRTAHNSEKVITYFEKPSRHRPNGRMIILVGESNIVYYGDLPYSRIPIVQMQCIEVAGQFFGKSVIEALIPRQRAYNGCVNRIHEYIKRIAIQGYMAERDSIDLDDYEEKGSAPGAILEYEKGYEKPTPIQNGNLPSEVMNERQYLKNEMEYVAGVSQLMVSGNTPTGVTSGTAISNLMEIDNTRLSLTGDHIRNSIKNLAVLWLEIYKKYANTKRVLNTVGKNNIGSAVVWDRNEINSFDVEYTTENELLMSDDMQKQNFMQAFQMGLFLDSDGRVPERFKNEAIEYMRCGNYSELMGINSLQQQKARQENAMFVEGVVPKVTEFDEHEIHIDEHMRYMLQLDFQILKRRKPEYAKAFEDHVRIHKQVAEQEKQINMMQMMQGGN